MSLKPGRVKHPGATACEWSMSYTCCDLGVNGRVGKGLDLKREGPGRATKITTAEERKKKHFQDLKDLRFDLTFLVVYGCFMVFP